MASAARVFRNLYRDSVSLMQLSAKLGALAGVRQASAIMATAGQSRPAARGRARAGRRRGRAERPAGRARGRGRDALEAALAAAEAELTRAPARTAGRPAPACRRAASRWRSRELPTANLALISTPGDYAAAEAMKALRLGLNVMLFSDNVALEDEIALKRYARAHELLVMGPDCGTAIIGGVPLGFANVVRRGDDRRVAASGTGLQQVTCLIDRWGRGISQAIGTGGHDLHAEVGGITMLQGLEALAADPATPRHRADLQAARTRGRRARSSTPPAARRQADRGRTSSARIPTRCGARTSIPVRTLEDAARLAVALAGGGADAASRSGTDRGARREVRSSAPGQKYIRGLFSGGTFCYEALLLLTEALGAIASNTPLEPEQMLADVWRSERHTVIDLGDDAFTRGRPHPMIDQRCARSGSCKEAADPEVAVILFDVVLGYGAHPDPAPRAGRRRSSRRAPATAAGAQLALVGSVCGTAGDPQDLARQEAALREAGVLLADSNAQAVAAGGDAIAARQA